ncbi:hypothetical protein [Symmachiella dynata]|uniref:YncE family protein n=1 Tax=Symmachiella dynata TaxID=2527995 RepID=UPI0030EF48D2
MNLKNWTYVGLLLVTFMMVGCGQQQELITFDASAHAAEEPEPSVICRLFLQDRDTRKLRWADVLQGNPPSLGEMQDVDDFPVLDAERQNLVQMDSSQGTLLVGVRDDAGGEFQSGWLLLATGVEEEAHGDHGHWSFDNKPRIIARKLDDQQGNPAHLYLYRDVYYLANDRNNGYTRVDPSVVDGEGEVNVSQGFHAGGGHHITLAVAENTTGYGTWIDGGGPNQGRVDVTRIQPEGNEEISYSLALPTGVIHGATTAADKVFFAPADGICWVAADLDPMAEHADTEIHHIALGENPETKKPLRTGAFATHRDYVCFVYGEEDYAMLGLLNAKETSPQLVSVPLPMQPGNGPTVPAIVKAADGRRLVFVFHNHSADVEGDEFLSIVQLDPNQDLGFSDAQLLKTIPVGHSAVEGHYGHHQITFDHAGQYAFWTNPGDSTISIMSLKDLGVLATVPVGGKPTKLIALGEEDHGH